MSETSETPSKQERGGVIGWMVSNRVTPNLLMLFFLIGGVYISSRIKQEVFPEFDMDMVSIRVIYPGASPEIIEQGIILSIESGIQGIDGIKEIRATAMEGVGEVTAELHQDAEHQRVYQDIKQAIDRITTFPGEAERPQVTLVTRRREVLNLQIYGQVSEQILRQVTEQVRERLLLDSMISQVDILGARDLQVHIEVSQDKLRAYGLSLQEIATRIQRASVEIPGGKLETRGGQIVLRLQDRRDWARQFAHIPLVTTSTGTVLRVSDLATVKEGFEDTNRFGLYDGKPSMALAVFRVGDQTPIALVDAVRKVMDNMRDEFPPGIFWTINRDRSSIYKQRLGLLLKNAVMGLALVLVMLGLFLEFRLAFWVTMGIPTSFLGSLLFLYAAGISINMISMFAFIIALGIVVDDAIVAGENIYEYRSMGMSSEEAAIFGARNVSLPIAFSILTNIVAFLPLYSMPGWLGKVWKVIPAVVITVFLLSWIESMLVLPSHLAHIAPLKTGKDASFFVRGQQAFANLLKVFIDKVYGPFLAFCIRWRLLAVAVCLAILILTMGFVMGRRIRMILMPRVESDVAIAVAMLPNGSPQAKARSVEKKLREAVERVAAKHGGKRLLKGVFSLIEENKIEVLANLRSPTIRPLSTREVTRFWRQELGPIDGLQFLRFEADRGGPGSGAALSIELSHSHLPTLNRACAMLAAKLAEFPYVKDIDEGFASGKQQLSFRIKTAGMSLGLTSAEIGRQLRDAFYGAQALRQQRGRNEIRVLVRLPESERNNPSSIEELLIRTPAGSLVPLKEVATVVAGRAFTSIERRDARRTITVSADVDPIGQTGQVAYGLDLNVLPQLKRDFPGLTYRYAGRRADMAESLHKLWQGFLLAAVGIYFLLAVAFGSYLQPLVVMLAIPFGIVGAVLGHVMMGFNLSLLSMMGIVALSGVVINDSLVLIDYINTRRKEGATPMQAAFEAGTRRFRPILLTTLTTFGGLAPMIFETSRQARFMIPMALSLGYGILFATVIILVLVPCLYLLIEDVRSFVFVRLLNKS